MQAGKTNIYDIKSLPKTSTSKSEPSEPKKGFLKRFLLWSSLLRTSTMNKEKNEEWNWSFIAIIVLIFAVISMAFVVLVIIGGFLWLDYKEDFRGSETWREKRTYDNEQSLIKKCENTTLRQQGLLKLLEQSNQQIPSEYAKVEQCGIPNMQPPPTGEH
jgi:hypothetical protein